MKLLHLLISLALCQAAGAATASENDGWTGVYTSTTEIAGYTSTVLALKMDSRRQVEYRMRFSSDGALSQKGITPIREEEKTGTALTEDDRIYLPIATGLMQKRKAYLHASVFRYTRVQLNGQHVLMRDDAYEAFKTRNELYDYGILIKVGDSWNLATDLDKAKHESIKILYTDQSKEWKDPFVNGANPR